MPEVTAAADGPMLHPPFSKPRAARIQARDPLRGQPIAALADAWTAEAIVRAIGSDDRIPASSAAELQTSRHRDGGEAVAAASLCSEVKAVARRASCAVRW